MNVITTKKTDLKLKDVCFSDGHLTDENGEVVNLLDVLQAVFGSEQFTLTATVTTKEEHEIDEFYDDIVE